MTLQKALTSLVRSMATNDRCWWADEQDAWVYGIVCGWDDDLPGPKAEHAMAEVAAIHGWSDLEVETLRAYHRAFEIGRTNNGLHDAMRVAMDLLDIYADGRVPTDAQWAGLSMLIERVEPAVD